MRPIERLHRLLDLWKARARKHTDAEMMHRGLEKREAKDGALRWMRRDGGEGTKRLPTFGGAPAPSGGGGKRKGKGGGGSRRGKKTPVFDQLTEALGPPGTVLSPEAFADHVEATLGPEARERADSFVYHLWSGSRIDVDWRRAPSDRTPHGVAGHITVRPPPSAPKPYTALTSDEAMYWLLAKTWRGSERSDALGLVPAMYSKKGREKRKQWRDHFARLLHPDRNPDPRAGAAMGEVNAIYEFMSSV